MLRVCHISYYIMLHNLNAVDLRCIITVFSMCILQRSNRAVTEHTFYQLVQYFAVVLFECDEADDFSPAMILMNMCFTFYYEGWCK